jgi:hypothetical protein
VQFVIVFLHASQVFIFECDYPKLMAFLAAFNALYFLYLFGMFYNRTYSAKKHL